MKSNPTILDVFNWHKYKEVDLPQVQRGFVWRPHQIENLWDSLLRGYPIGSFIFASKSKHMQKPSLLDGQQRATSISLAFQNLDNVDKIFNAQDIGIFIDLKKPNLNDTRKYIFRVITKSHPWGYHREDNRKTLDRNNIEGAKILYDLKNDEKFYKKELKCFWPYDAGLPVPFHLFLNSAMNDKSIETLRDDIKIWYKNFKGSKEEFTSPKTFNEQLELCLTASVDDDHGDFYSVAYIYSQINNLFKKTLPVSFLDLQYTNETRPDFKIDNNDVKEGNSDIDEAEEMDEIENLFVRLNSAGTPLRGEELNYSILKAVLSHKTQEALEESCKGFVGPARFITIAYRLFQHCKDPKTASIIMRIKPKDFQKVVRESGNIAEFEECITNQLLPIVKKTRSLLTYHKEENPNGLPPYLITRISDSSPEIVFMLMYRLLIHKDNIELNENIHTKMLGMFTLFAWFGRGLKLKNHEPLMRNISKVMISFNCEEFWSHHTVTQARQLHRDQLVLFPILSQSKIKRKIGTIVEKNSLKIDNGSFSNISTFDKENIEFYRKAFFEKSLIVFAQREYFDLKFPEAEMNLDDTNVPFDWDHISPQAIINRTGAYQCLKDWYSSNGNYRALSYSENRSKSDNHPSEHLDPATSMLHYRCRYKDWKKHSFGRQDMKENENQKTIFRLIMERNLDIYTHWLETLKINDLLKQDDQSIILAPLWNMLNQQSWKYSKDDQVFYLKFDDLKSEIYFEFENEGGGALGQANAQFGIFMKDRKNLQSLLVNNNCEVEKADGNTGYVVMQLTTLEGHQENNFTKFVQEFVDFLSSFEYEFKLKILEQLRMNISPKYVNDILWDQKTDKKSA